MNDAECVAFLQWALPRMSLQWSGFRKVRRLVCKRISRRCQMLGLADVAAYRQRLETIPDEWHELRSLCSIPISRFMRDREMFRVLEGVVLPELADAARGARTFACWSAGCASGEEPYTLSIIWELALAARYPSVRLQVLATDVDPVLLERAVVACYPASALRELPAAWRAAAFATHGATFCLRRPFRTSVEFLRQDLCTAMPDRRFDLVLCRNVAFTYFSRDAQLTTARGLADRLRVGGALVIGVHESLPLEAPGFVAWQGARSVFRRVAARAGG
jgi:chemotaxis protein methyltransferase CheR